VDTFWVSLLWQQFGAAIDMLENAIRTCPGEVWSNPSKRPEWVSNDVAGFWYVAYHAFFSGLLRQTTSSAPTWVAKTKVPLTSE
jgi:hypothetical protein